MGAMFLQERAPTGTDVVMGMVGGEPFQEALKVAKWGAHLATHLYVAQKLHTRTT